MFVLAFTFLQFASNQAFVQRFDMSNSYMKAENPSLLLSLQIARHISFVRRRDVYWYVFLLDS